MIVISSWHVTGTSPIVRFGPPNFVALYARLGSQIQFAMPMIEKSNETVTTSLMVSVVRCSPRKMTTSRNTPNSGAEHEEHDRDRDRRRPAPVEAQLPVGERAEHADGAVGEVEHARRRVRQYEPAGELPRGSPPVMRPVIV